MNTVIHKHKVSILQPLVQHMTKKLGSKYDVEHFFNHFVNCICIWLKNFWTAKGYFGNPGLMNTAIITTDLIADYSRLDIAFIAVKSKA